jgi:hypothetical protein
VGRQRGALQIREGTTQGVAPARGQGLAQGTLGADEDGGCDGQLGQVDVQRRLRRAERRRREVDEHGAFVEEEDVARVQPSVGDTGRVEAGDLLEQALERLVAHLLRLEGLERREVGLPCDDERVAVRAESGRDDFRDADSRLAASAVASASCSTCSSRPTGTLLGGSR